jgi:hypothetical protein
MLFFVTYNYEVTLKTFSLTLQYSLFFSNIEIAEWNQYF